MGTSGSKEVGSRCWKYANDGSYEELRNLLTTEDNICELIQWRDQAGKTPLLAATEHGHGDCVHLLLNAGANVNATDRRGNTSLHYAVGKGYIAVLTKLLESPTCNLFAVNNHSKTALDTARQAYLHSNHVNILSCIQLLESKMVIYQGWLYFSSDNFASSSLGLQSLKGWSRRYCLVFQTHSNDLLEMALFVSPNGVMREALPRDTIIYRVSSSASPVSSTKWFNTKQYCFRIYGYPKDASGDIMEIEMACKEEVDLQNWLSFLNNTWSYHCNTTGEILPSTTTLPPTGNQSNLILSPLVPSNNSHISTLPMAPSCPNSMDIPKDGDCIICMNQARNAAAVPCGHVATCVTCLEEIKANTGRCPICRARLTQVIRLYHT